MEKCGRVTRLVKKRVAAGAPEHEPVNKKRAVLGELTNLSDDKVENLKPSRRARVQEKKNPAVVKDYDVEVEAEDPQMCGPYVSDIYKYLHKMEMEPKRRPLQNYLEKIQKDITPNMRAILVDWLIEVAEEYKLCSTTLYLSISYIDLFLSQNFLNKQKLQLLGVSAMLIASKYEEISPPNVEDFCYITDNTYSKQEVVKMESDILNCLKFEMGSPTTLNFLRRLIGIALEDQKILKMELEFLCEYLAELSLLDYGCINFLPSRMSASVVFLARFTMSPSSYPWNSRLQHFSGYKPSELKLCVKMIHELQSGKRGSALKAPRDKYKHSKFKCVSALLCPQDIPNSFFKDI